MQLAIVLVLALDARHTQPVHGASMANNATFCCCCLRICCCILSLRTSACSTSSLTPTCSRFPLAKLPTRPGTGCNPERCGSRSRRPKRSTELKLGPTQSEDGERGTTRLVIDAFEAKDVRVKVFAGPCRLEVAQCTCHRACARVERAGVRYWV